MTEYSTIFIDKKCTIKELMFIIKNNSVVWNLDESVAPILKSLGIEACKELALHGFVNIPPLRIRYFPGKVFIIYYLGKAYKIYGIDQYYPNDIKPKTHIELQSKLEQLLQALAIMKIEPAKLTSPIAIYEPYLASYHLPAYCMPEEAMIYAYSCSSRLWIEAFKLGYWETAYDYDLTSAFPNITKKLVDTKTLQWTKTSYYKDTAVYSYARCKVNIHADISPIIYEYDGKLITPKGRWSTYLTKSEIDFIRNYNLGEVEIIDGWWGLHTPYIQFPMQIVIERLLDYKKHSNSIVQELAKRISVGIYGKFGQHLANEQRFGDYFNPCWFTEISTRTRLNVAHFIFSNRLENSLIATSVDGVITDKKVEKLNGSWRENYHGEVLVVSSGMQYFDQKKPQGMTLEDIKKKVKRYPYTGYYEKINRRPVTFKEALEKGKLEDIGKIVSKVTSLNLYGIEHDRVFKEKPTTGGMLMFGKHYESEAITIQED